MSFELSVSRFRFPVSSQQVAKASNDEPVPASWQLATGNW
jgi:hypothetical protein